MQVLWAIVISCETIDFFFLNLQEQRNRNSNVFSSDPKILVCMHALEAWWTLTKPGLILPLYKIPF